MKHIENERGRIVAKFVLLNLADDLCSATGNVLGSMAGFFKSASMSIQFAQYDQARKYEDLTGGDFGTVIGCPGHYSGACQHSTRQEGSDGEE